MAKKKQTNERFLGAVFTDEGGELIHNYDLWRNDDSDEGETILKYTPNNLMWAEHIRNTIAGFVIDTGNEIYIQIGKKRLSVDYAEMEVLTAIIMSCTNQEMEFRQYKVTSSLKPTL